MARKPSWGTWERLCSWGSRSSAARELPVRALSRRSNWRLTNDFFLGGGAMRRWMFRNFWECLAAISRRHFSLRLTLCVIAPSLSEKLSSSSNKPKQSF